VHPERVETVLADGFAGVTGIIRKPIEDGYRQAQARAPWAYEFLYALNKLPGVARLSCALVAWFVRRPLARLLATERPDKIVVLHFFLVRPVYQVLHAAGQRVPVVTVVTDPFTAHPIWFLQPGQRLVVFSRQLQQQLQPVAHRFASINVFPFTIDERFSHAMPHADVPAVRQRHGFAPDLKLVLVLGGGDGMPRGRRILRRLLAAPVDAQFAVVCGRNTRLLSQMQALRREFPRRRMRVYGFVDFIPELIGMADLVVTKCGASTFMEILCARRIPVINSYLWEQEKGNVEFITGNTMGIYERRVRRLPKLVERLLADHAFAGQFRENIERLAPQNGTPQVAEFLLTAGQGAV
jgi:processive 1,2-diacylglycerol beta-glucosyltransferase/1,2-diacylglycerol 3-beta-galactosyltransferase